MELFREAPAVSTFVPLSEHQSSTPASFYNGPPVLHYSSKRCKVLVLEAELCNSPALATFAQQSKATEKSHGRAVNGESHTEDDDGMNQTVVEGVDVWVTSEKLLLYSADASVGVAIPYPSILLHAIQSLPQPSPTEHQGLYMQLISVSTNSAEEDNEPDSISVTIVPTTSADSPAAGENDSAENLSEQTPVVAMFAALSNCSNLHPDPIVTEDQDEDPLQGSRLFHAGMILPGDAGGGLPPALPGSGGWITAENMHEFVDEEGNWIDADEEQEVEALGPGAGTIRTREQREELGDEDNLIDETKWRKTS